MGARPSTVRASGAPSRRPQAVKQILDLNLASEADLRALPGVGPRLAQRILASRAADGPFASVAELCRIPSVPPKLVDRLVGRLTAIPPPPRALVAMHRPGQELRVRWIPVAGAPPPPALRRLLPPPRPVIEEIEPDDWEASPDPEPAPVAAERPVAAAASPWVLEDEASTRPPWIRLAGVLAVALIAVVTGVLVGGRDQGFARHREVETWAADLRALLADQATLKERVERVEPMGAQLPAAVARVEARSAGLEARQRESAAALAEAQASVRRLGNEVAALREGLYKSQKSSERRLQEMRAQMQDRPAESARGEGAGHGAVAASALRRP
jgi:hypothetical protein